MVDFLKGRSQLLISNLKARMQGGCSLETLSLPCPMEELLVLINYTLTKKYVLKNSMYKFLSFGQIFVPETKGDR